MDAKKSDTDLMKKVRGHVRKGTYILSRHAIDRKEGRYINLPDVLHVLLNGIHEREKDIYTERDSRIGISAVPKPRGSTIVSCPIFLILGNLRSLNRESFRISPNPIIESRSVYDVKRQTWKHAIRGKTINGMDLRVVVACPRLCKFLWAPLADRAPLDVILFRRKAYSSRSCEIKLRLRGSLKRDRPIKTCKVEMSRRNGNYHINKS